MNKYYKIQVYDESKKQWWTRYTDHDYFPSIEAAQKELHIYTQSVRIVEVLEKVNVVDTYERFSMEKSLLTCLLRTDPVLINNNLNIFRIQRVVPSNDSFHMTLGIDKSCLWAFSLRGAYITDGKLNVARIDNNERMTFEVLQPTYLK